MVYLPYEWQSVCNQYKAFTNFFHAHAEIHADKVFIRYYVQSNGAVESGCYKSLTYAEVEHMATNVACQLLELLPQDTKTNRVLGYLGDYGLDYVIVMLACLKLRMTLFNISPRNSETAITHLLEKTGCRILLTSVFREQIANNAFKATCFAAEGSKVFTLPPLQLEQLLQQPHRPERLLHLDTQFSDVDIEKIPLIIHSSGSTNFPKPIYLSNRYMFHLISMLYVQANNDPNVEPITEKDVYLSLGPLFHIFGIMCTFMLVSVGGSFVVLPKLPPSQKEIEHAIKANHVTFFGCLPFVMEEMLLHFRSVDKPDISYLQSLKCMTFGGSPLRWQTGEWFHKHGIKVRNTYGATEMSTSFSADLNPNTDTWYSLRTCLKDAQGQSYAVFEEVSPDVYHLYIRGDYPGLATNVSNRPDGGFDTNDLFKRDADHPGFYIYLGRRDDTLIMENGEKTNPIPMEAAIRAHPIVKQVAVVGHARHCTACLVQVDMEYGSQLTPHEIIEQVYDAVRASNVDCPTHSKIIVPDMVYTLPLNQQLPSTDKGTIKRKAALAQYEAVVDKLYTRFMNRDSKIHRASVVADDQVAKNTAEKVETWTAEALSDFLAECVSTVLDIPYSIITQNTSVSLFNYGLNSLSAIQLRNLLTVRFGWVTLNFLFHNTSIDAICKALLLTIKKESGVQTDRAIEEEAYRETQELADAYIRKATVDFQLAAFDCNVEKRENVILLTGATGTTGAFILRDLLMRDDVKKVYCCVRGATNDEEHLFGRLIEAFESRSLDTAMLADRTRVEAVPMRFKDTHLGWTTEKYNQLREEVTIVQHCAWLLDFHMPVSHYDKECIAPFYNLLTFALRKVNPMQVHFISSISASARSANKPSNIETNSLEMFEEPVPLDSHAALPMGYAQSKFICESLLNFLVTERQYPCFIERLGQICGDTVNGIWNTSEQYPRMFIGGGVFLHKLPAAIPSLHTIDWIPVDYASSAIVDIMLSTQKHAASRLQFIYHIVNPNRTTWSQVLEAAKEAGLDFVNVSSAEWVSSLKEALEKPSSVKNNPAYPLLPYYERVLLNDEDANQTLPSWSTVQTVKVAARLKDAPPLNAKLFKKLLIFWSKELSF